MKQTIIITILFFMCGNVNAQMVGLTWAGQFGGTGDDVGNAVFLDNSGNVFTVGQFSGTADFDPGAGTANLTSAGAEDVFISKLDAAGNFQWVKQIGGFNFDNAYAVHVDAAGNIYVAGGFSGTVDFDPGPGVNNLSASFTTIDIFILKLNAAGNFVWAKAIGGGGSDFVSAIDVDASGNVYATGHFSMTVDFDPGPGTFSIFTNGFEDIYILKLDGSGNFIAALRIGGTLVESARALKVNATGQIYIAGFFSGTVDFDPGAGTSNMTSIGNRDAYVCKINPAGNLIWAKQFGGSDDDEVYGMTLDASGNVFTTGQYKGMVDFDPGAGTSNMAAVGGNDIFVSKLDGSGNFGWAKTFGGSGFDRGLGIAVDPWGDVYTTGLYSSTVDFDPGAGVQNLIALGNNDIYISKLDATGNFGFAVGFDASVNGAGRAIAVAPDGNVHTCGEFEGTINADPISGTVSLTAAGGSDIYVHKLHQVGVGIGDITSDSDWLLYPNPGNGSFVLDFQQLSGSVTVRIRNVMGQEISSSTMEGIRKYEIRVDDRPGVYFIEVLQENRVVGQSRFVNY